MKLCYVRLIKRRELFLDDAKEKRCKIYRRETYVATDYPNSLIFASDRNTANLLCLLPWNKIKGS